MSRIVVAYPRIAAADFAWIQVYRKRNDPRYFQLIDPHFTLVFPVADVSAEDFCREVRTQANATDLIAFEIKVATILTGLNFDLRPDQMGLRNQAKAYERVANYSTRVAPGGASPRRAAGASPVASALGAEHGVGRPGDRTRLVISQRVLRAGRRSGIRTI